MAAPSPAPSGCQSPSPAGCALAFLPAPRDSSRPPLSPFSPPPPYPASLLHFFIFPTRLRASSDLIARGAAAKPGILALLPDRCSLIPALAISQTTTPPHGLSLS